MQIQEEQPITIAQLTEECRNDPCKNPSALALGWQHPELRISLLMNGSNRIF
jgi:hypothetical protein